MNKKKTINILVTCIVFLSIIASSLGLFSNQGSGKYEFKALHGNTVTIYGKGLYQNDSVAMAAQGRSQDAVTLFIGIPLLLISLYLLNKKSLKGKLLLTGTLGYFLYTYTSYAFLSMFNPLFLVYVILMSMNFFAFTIMLLSFDMKNLSSSFDEKLPVKLIGGFLFSIAAAIGLMWLKIIVSPILAGIVPEQLEHYTTMPIQALDLGFIVPASVLAGLLILKRKPLGYLLSSVLIIKGITLLTAITAMIIGQAAAGIKVDLATMIIFPVFDLAACYPLYIILKSVKEVRNI